MEEKNQRKFDYVIELMATNPLKTNLQIDEAIEILHTKKADSVIAVTRVFDQHPARIKKIDKNGKLQNFCVEEPLEARRQDLEPPAYIRCGSIYAIRRDYLLKTGHRYGSENSYALIIPEEKSVNIDNLQDFKFAESVLQTLNKEG